MAAVDDDWEARKEMTVGEERRMEGEGGGERRRTQVYERRRRPLVAEAAAAALLSEDERQAAAMRGQAAVVRHMVSSLPMDPPSHNARMERWREWGANRNTPSCLIQFITSASTLRLLLRISRRPDVPDAPFTRPHNPSATATTQCHIPFSVSSDRRETNTAVEEQLDRSTAAASGLRSGVVFFIFDRSFRESRIHANTSGCGLNDGASR